MPQCSLYDMNPYTSKARLGAVDRVDKEPPSHSSSFLVNSLFRLLLSCQFVSKSHRFASEREVRMTSCPFQHGLRLIYENVQVSAATSKNSGP
eukprot:scaffold14687_cov119-Amphora_coffeaeformis.AAC.2